MRLGMCACCFPRIHVACLRVSGVCACTWAVPPPPPARPMRLPHALPVLVVCAGARRPYAIAPAPLPSRCARPQLLRELPVVPPSKSAVRCLVLGATLRTLVERQQFRAAMKVCAGRTKQPQQCPSKCAVRCCWSCFRVCAWWLCTPLWRCRVVRACGCMWACVSVSVGLMRCAPSATAGMCACHALARVRFVVRSGG
jgi:hypothetical protein